MQLPALRCVAYRSICIYACAYILTAAIILDIFVGTNQKLQAWIILRSKPEIYEYELRCWYQYIIGSCIKTSCAIFHVDHSTFSSPMHVVHNLSIYVQGQGFFQKFFKEGEDQSIGTL